MRAQEWGLLKTTAITWDGWDPSAHKTLPEEFWGLRALEVQPQDVVVTKAGPRHRVGVATYVTQTTPHLIVSGKMILLRANPNEVDPRVLAGVLAESTSQRYLDERTTGMAESQVNFTNQTLLQMPIKLPEIREQHQIADILETADNEIASLATLANKTVSIRAGLLRELFPSSSRETFRGWRFVTLDQCVKSPIKRGIEQPGPSVLDGVPYIQTGNMASESLDQECLLRTSRTVDAAYPATKLQANDIVCAIRATIGKVHLVPLELDGANLTRGTARISPVSGVNPRYLLWALRSAVVQRQFSHQARGTTFIQVSLQALRAFQVPFPDEVATQIKISDTLDELSNNLNQIMAALGKLKILKQGLMGDLLTGRVRVTAGRMENVGTE